MIGLSAAVIAIICLLTGLPISWKKCELGSCIVWIGWSFHLSAGYVSLPSPKRHKLLELLQKMMSSNHCSRRTLERFLGLALWVTQLWPEMRIWLHYLYKDLYSIPASQFSIDPGSWDEVLRCLSNELTFTSKPQHTAIPINGQLIQVRHHSVQPNWICRIVYFQIKESGYGFVTPTRQSENCQPLPCVFLAFIKSGWTEFLQ